MALSGLSPTSFTNMQLNAGVFLNQYTVEESMTVEVFKSAIIEAMEAGNTLGATSGGGTFVATPEIRQIEADGMRSPVIGSTVIDSWEIQLTTTLKEITASNLKIALTTAEVTKHENGITILKIRNNLAMSDYIPKMMWVGDMLDGRMVAIELQNVLNIAGTTLTFTDKGEGTIAVTLRGHQSDLKNLQYAPCKIWYIDSTTETAQAGFTTEGE